MKLRKLLLAAVVCALCVGQASALEYSFDAPEDYPFGRPTSQDIIYRVEEGPNVDRSKSTALIPPGFGTPTSYLPGSGEPLTPNMVPGALSGGLVSQVGSTNWSTTDTSISVPGISGNMDISYLPSRAAAQTTGFTEVTPDLFYSNGSLGTLKIPAIGLTVKIFQGTDSKALAKGAGHFEDTSIWDGNCCFAAHNRGTNSYFGKIHTLQLGDRIKLTTKLGTRTYAVFSVNKIGETDSSLLAPTTDNCITLFTCVRDQKDYRWAVRAVEIV